MPKQSVVRFLEIANIVLGGLVYVAGPFRSVFVIHAWNPALISVAVFVVGTVENKLMERVRPKPPDQTPIEIIVDKGTSGAFLLLLLIAIFVAR